MAIFILGRHLVWSRSDGNGETIFYYYYDAPGARVVITLIVAALALAWLAWFFVRRYRRARSLRRPSRRTAHRLPKRIIRIKRELSSQYLRPGFSANIHAVGIGKLAGSNQYCIQVFINNADEELWPGAGASVLPGSYRGVPLVLIEMATAAFLSDAALSPFMEWAQYAGGIREYQEVIVGGISGANSNLTGQSGTIGYFCTRKSRWTRRKEVHLLSNSHVFADLRKTAVDDGDLIMQPSPGEPSSNRPIAALVNFAALKFEGDLKEPNHIDAAIAKLWGPQPHRPVIPLIGAIKGYAAKKDVEIGEAARKYGRTTGYTEGRVFSVYMDIWIRYDRTRQSAFFQDQLLIEPALPKFNQFVIKGDSGALLVDAEQYATGLIFAGTSEAPQSSAPTNRLTKVEGYGVANPIGEVLERLKIELLV